MRYNLIAFLIFLTVFAITTAGIQKGISSMSENEVVAEDIPLWGCFETIVTNTKNYANPFTDTTLDATFTRPDGSVVSFWGFHDGDGNGGQSGNIWKLRFMLDQIGTWKYVCSFSDGTPGKLTADQVRTGAWGSVMGGAFYLYAECFKPTLTWGDGDAFLFVEIMNDFIYGLQYWKLQPNNALVDSESLCLANIGQEYVIYCQNVGTITVTSVRCKKH